jgi:putative heme iron utilization protein
MTIGDNAAARPCPDKRYKNGPVDRRILLDKQRRQNEPWYVNTCPGATGGDIMNKHIIKTTAFVLAAVWAGGSSAADPMCASAEQAQQIRDFYAENPGTAPVRAARQMRMPEELIASAITTEHAAGTGGEDFAEVWKVITTWDKPMTVITKGADVFEVFSAIPSGERSTENQFYNLGHDHALSGHLRPDLYTSIYAYALPRGDGRVTRAVFFYDGSGPSIFGVVMSGRGPAPPDTELAKFDELMTVIRSLPPVCAN